MTAIDGDLSEVRSFEILTSDGETLVLHPDPEGEFAFPLPHLASHRQTLYPVRVTYRVAPDGRLIATKIDDA